MSERKKGDRLAWNDRIHVLLPKGGRDALKAELGKRFSGTVSMAGYFKMLVELDLEGKVDWSDYDGNFDLLYKMAASEKK